MSPFRLVNRTWRVLPLLVSAAGLSPPTVAQVCEPRLAFTYPGGVPNVIAPSGGTTFRVVVGPVDCNVPVTNSGLLHYDAGSGFTTRPMTEVAPNIYEASFPATPWCAQVRYFVSARVVGGARISDPANAPATTQTAFSTTGLTTLVSYDFNTAPAGWTVTNQGLTSGAWTRVTPSQNNGSRRDPPSDYDGSGLCWVTGHASDEDVDGGPTILTTETFSLGAATDPYVSFSRWAQNDDGDDAFRFEVSDDGGTSWTLVEQVFGDTTGWEVMRYRIRNHATGLERLVFRFVVADNPNDSVTEAGVDAFEMFDFQCFVLATWDPLGTGCLGSSGVPVLWTNDLPAAGEAFSTNVFNVPAGGSAFGTIGFSNAPPFPIDLGAIGASGCTLYHDPVVTIPLTATNGRASFSVDIPPGPTGIVGRTFFEQGLIIDQAANSLGLTATNAIRARIGYR